MRALVQDGREAAGALRPAPPWRCPYCAFPLEGRWEGLFCPAEERFFSAGGGVARLLPEGRRREMRPLLELYQRIRRDEGWRAEPGLPDVPATHPRASLWARRARHFHLGVALARAALGPGPWRVLEVGAGSAWASLRLLEEGHAVVATDVSLDAEDGLLAPNRFLADPLRLPRAEAEMDALPLAAASFDLVLAAGCLHYAPDPTRALIELRRVASRGGVLLVLDSPVYSRVADGETMVAARRREHAARYGVAEERLPPSGFLPLPALSSLFEGAGFRLEVHGWPGPWREAARDVLERLRHGRRTARFPVLLGHRRG
jgi:SAM-dependent methyltransferase